MSFKRIGQDNYVKDDITFQDTVNEDKEKVLELLKDYIRIPHEYCEHLVLGSKIKYISDEGNFRTGGILTKNGFPNYIVLLNPYKKLTWSVNLKKNNIFMEDLRKVEKEKKDKENLYKLYNAGMLVVKDKDNGNNSDNNSDNDN